MRLSNETVFALEYICSAVSGNEMQAAAVALGWIRRETTLGVNTLKVF